jgi:hypothetical protein
MDILKLSAMSIPKEEGGLEVPVYQADSRNLGYRLWLKGVRKIFRFTGCLKWKIPI